MALQPSRWRGPLYFVFILWPEEGEPSGEMTCLLAWMIQRVHHQVWNTEGHSTKPSNVELRKGWLASFSEMAEKSWDLAIAGLFICTSQRSSNAFVCFVCVWIFEDQSEWRCSIHCRCFEAATADSFYLLEAKISAWIRICTKVQWRNHQEFLQSIQPYREEPPFSWNPSRRHVWQWKQGS